MAGMKVRNTALIQIGVLIALHLTVTPEFSSLYTSLLPPVSHRSTPHCYPRVLIALHLTVTPGFSSLYTSLLPPGSHRSTPLHNNHTGTRTSVRLSFCGCL
ncbi:uncharacterized [Tachysurus ichikawai]